MLDGKVMIILLAIGLMKRYSCIKPEPYIHKKKQYKSWIRFAKLFNKMWYKNTAGADTSKFAKKDIFS